MVGHEEDEGDGVLREPLRGAPSPRMGGLWETGREHLIVRSCCLAMLFPPRAILGLGLCQSPH